MRHKPVLTQNPVCSVYLDWKVVGKQVDFFAFFVQVPLLVKSS